MSRAPKRPIVGVWPVDRHAGAWPPGGPLYHCHNRGRNADAFNDNPAVRARFSPIRDGAGVIPAWYGGTTIECAVAESLFHDIPVATVGVVPQSKLKGRLITVVRPARTLRLLRLDVDGLRAAALDLSTTESEADRYADTGQCAQDLYDGHPDIDGLVWVSRRRNVDAAVVLYAAGGDGSHPGGMRPGDLTVDPVPVRDFEIFDDWKWLHDYAQTLRIDVYYR